MTRVRQICIRPFTVYRWQPGPNARYKKTELCRTCAKIKNVCQTCVFDLQYGLPVQVRDSVLEEYEKTKIPESNVGRGYVIEQMERKLVILNDDILLMVIYVIRSKFFWGGNIFHFLHFVICAAVSLKVST